VSGKLENELDLAQALEDSDNWEKVKYVVTHNQDDVLWDYASANLSLVAVVKRKTKPPLFIFSSQEHGISDQVDWLDASKFDDLFDRKYGTWREIVPWFYPMVQERLK
jgi:hypothetical protein